MNTDYPALIEQSEEALLRLERQLRGEAVEARVKMLRLLKSGAYTSRRSLAATLGYSERQLHRWWKRYRRAGLEGLLEERAVGGSTERVTEEAWHALDREMQRGRIRRLRDAQAFLRDRYGIEYRSLQGVADLINRRREAS